MKRAVHLILAFGLAAFVSGCSLDLPGSGEPARIFVLSPKSTFREDLPAVDWQLLIDTPISAAGISSSRIALQQNARELEYYSRAAWTDASPKLIQTLLIESFENSGKILAVGRQTIGLRSDFLLSTELREFQAEYYDDAGRTLPKGTPPRVRVRLNVKLIKMPQRAIVGSETMEGVVRAKNTDMVSVVQAYDEALGKVLKETVHWTLRQGEKVRDRAGR
ncbi:ABC-type transport auxiliary lipoprotein family protein [Aestuariispira ectoiniformans]|uniref:ABC-type transport auxiliary lipoprotein family protein n=1 Tax=Aestuariispira ectoiniformans TaxID=2775080 RepID=UPI00223C3149|nr:ABC-type transport auxiliary lipoprotein family protein [Aestuariispira ectoiniformans]